MSKGEETQRENERGDRERRQREERGDRERKQRERVQEKSEEKRVSKIEWYLALGGWGAA